MDCTFCGTDIEKGTGSMFVKKDGTQYFFCTKKCEKNMLKLKRKPRKVGWTDEYHKVKALERLGKKEKKKVVKKVVKKGKRALKAEREAEAAKKRLQNLRLKNQR